jgi:hypothetical protein
MSKELSNDALIAKSIEYSAIGFIDKFEADCQVTLKEVTNLSKLSFKNCKETVVLHKVGGGALPYKVGSWELVRDVQGNLVSIGVYKKHR